MIPVNQIWVNPISLKVFRVLSSNEENLPQPFSAIVPDSVNDSLATVDRYEINDILYADESGDIIGTKAKPDTVIYRSIYKIADGRFVKKMEKRIK